MKPNTTESTHHCGDCLDYNCHALYIFIFAHEISGDRETTHQEESVYYIVSLPMPPQLHTQPIFTSGEIVS